MRPLFLATLAVAAWLAAPIRLAAQAHPTQPATGQRVRVHLAGHSSFVDGTVVGWAADTLVLGPLHRERSLPDTLMRLPQASIAGYQLSLGPDRSRGFVQGAKTGALVGGGIGLVLLFIGILSDAGGCQGDSCSPVPATLVGGVLAVGTTLGGMVIGAALGPAAAPEAWSEERSVALRERPAGTRRLALVLSLAR